jgi:hypothetical protein
MGKVRLGPYMQLAFLWCPGDVVTYQLAEVLLVRQHEL